MYSLKGLPNDVRTANFAPAYFGLSLSGNQPPTGETSTATPPALCFGLAETEKIYWPFNSLVSKLLYICINDKTLWNYRPSYQP